MKEMKEMKMTGRHAKEAANLDDVGDLSRENVEELQASWDLRALAQCVRSLHTTDHRAA